MLIDSNGIIKESNEEMAVEGYHLPSQRISITGSTSEIYYIVDALFRYAAEEKRAGE